MDLDSMKYAELRVLAKELGLKANMKTDKLLKAIKKHYQEKPENNRAEEQAEDVTDVQEDPKETQNDAQEHEAAPCTFVNTRRGRGNGTKRKIADVAPATECDSKTHPTAAEEDNRVAVTGTPSGAKGAKKRRVSSTKDSENSETEASGPEQQQQQPFDIKDEALVPNKEKAPKAGKIPRYQRLPQKNKPLLKPVTPNFKKLHEAQFNKMESIDTYIQRKTKQLETYKSSVKELKQLSDKIKLKQAEGKTQEKMNRASMFSPVPANKRTAEDKRRNTLLSASKAPQDNKAAGKEDAKFRPSVLSTRRINVRFSEASRDNECKKSMVRTPARMSSYVTSSTPKKTAADGGKPNNVRTSTFSATKTPGTFVFTGNTSTSTTPGTQTKSKFDLKASLSRPLSYKPHAGKLKPFGETTENPAGNKSLNSTISHQKNYKQHQVQTREDRRTKQTENRKQKKENMLGARRGLVMM
ncbi:nucleolar and spindle-associated protein 1 [Antennarius striatus]|uniref:nucleolar and spindle-associated protein 1 n=1 Tax=Antennarius striatus TaxID=241820 RepID=UPI0035B1172A